MKISCLIPDYNGEKHLRAALQSIMDQTYQEFEVIVVNDGSNDKSGDILDEYSRKYDNFKVFHKENGGIVSALNFGLQFCKGDYIARMDCDDIAMRDRFEIQLQEFNTRRDAVAVGGYLRWIDDNDNIAPGKGFSPSRVTHTSLRSFPAKVANVQHSAGMFLSKAIREVGGYRSTFKHAEDYDLYLRLAKFGGFYNPAKPVIYYRQHPSSLSAQNLLEQETNAVLAELSACARLAGVSDPGDFGRSMGLDEYNKILGDIVCPIGTISRYIDFRMLRRLNSINSPDANEYRRRIFRGLSKPSNYCSRKDLQLNARIVLSIGRSWLRRKL